MLKQLKLLKFLKAVVDVIVGEVESGLRDLVAPQQLLDFHHGEAPEGDSPRFQGKGLIHKLTPLSAGELHAKRSAIEEKTKDAIAIACFRPAHRSQESCDIGIPAQHGQSTHVCRQKNVLDGNCRRQGKTFEGIGKLV